MGLFCIDPFWDDTQTLSHPEDMGINREGLSAHAKEKETVNGLWANAFEATQCLLYLFRTHPPEESEAEFSLAFLNPPQEIKNAPRFLIGQSTRSYGLNDRSRSCLEEIFPMREPTLQPMVGPIPILIVGVL